jgi:hypothetical protein
VPVVPLPVAGAKVDDVLVDIAVVDTEVVDEVEDKPIVAARLNVLAVDLQQSELPPQHHVPCPQLMSWALPSES